MLVKLCIAFLRMDFGMMDMVHCSSSKNGSQNPHFQITLLLGREGSQKEYTVYALNNEDNYGRTGGLQDSSPR